MWFCIIYEEPKCNIDIIDSTVQWLGRKTCEKEVMGSNPTSRVSVMVQILRVVYRVPSGHAQWGPPTNNIPIFCFFSTKVLPSVRKITFDKDDFANEKIAVCYLPSAKWPLSHLAKKLCPVVTGAHIFLDLF